MVTPQPPNGALLITVLGAQAETRTALCRVLMVRLVARGVAATHLPCQAVPGPYPGSRLQNHAGALDAALSSAPFVLSESSVIHAAAARQADASDELQRAAHTELTRSAQLLLCAPSMQDDATVHALDAHLRQSLLKARASFCVIHGQGPAAEAQAWQALCLALDWPLDAEPDSASATRRTVWRGACDTCSDAGCEHRVFSDLIAQRARA